MWPNNIFKKKIITDTHLFNEVLPKLITESVSSVTQPCPILCDPHGLHHARLPCPSPTPGACSNSCPSSQWCHPTVSSSVVPFSSCLGMTKCPVIILETSCSEEFTLGNNTWDESQLVSLRKFTSLGPSWGYWSPQTGQNYRPWRIGVSLVLPSERASPISCCLSPILPVCALLNIWSHTHTHTHTHTHIHTSMRCNTRSLWHFCLSHRSYMLSQNCLPSLLRKCSCNLSQSSFVGRILFLRLDCTRTVRMPGNRN